MLNQLNNLWIGTSNIVLLGNKTTFPSAFQSKSRLHYYSSLFNTLEVNSSFYKTPLFSTYKKWEQEVPQDFKFSIKLSKEVTHIKDLQSDLESLRWFMESAKGIHSKKGCLLVQFPGKITIDHFNQVEQILEKLKALDPSNEWKKALEFREPGWYIGETWEFLDMYGATMVLHDFRKAPLFEIRGRARHIYIRFHGPNGDYRDGYADNFLNQKATQIRKWIDDGKEVYVYFNNTIGAAFENALHLKSLLKV